LRRILANTLDKQALDGGLDAEITDIEDEPPIMRIKSVLMTRSISYLLMSKAWAPVEWRKTGFSRVVFTNGHESWTYDVSELK
jgi:hypothetical protein